MTYGNCLVCQPLGGGLPCFGVYGSRKREKREHYIGTGIYIERESMCTKDSLVGLQSTRYYTVCVYLESDLSVHPFVAHFLLAGMFISRC